MGWDQVYLNTKEFTESIENSSYEEVLEKLRDFDKTVYLLFENLKTDLPINDQLLLLKDTYKYLALFPGPLGPIGVLLVNDEMEFHNLFWLYSAVLTESTNFTKH